MYTETQMEEFYDIAYSAGIRNLVK